MNDHVHVLFSPNSDHRVEEILHTWKSYTAHALQRTGRVGPVWQDESFDRIVRTEAEFVEKEVYIRNNPRKRWPDVVDYPWVGVGNLDP